MQLTSSRMDAKMLHVGSMYENCSAGSYRCLFDMSPTKRDPVMTLQTQQGSRAHGSFNLY